MLILLQGDLHLTGKTPICRTDDLVTVQFEKLIEIINLANNHNCPIICTGDVLNVPIIANSILTTFGEVISKLKHAFYFVWGNHDLMYHNLDIYTRTSLGVLWHNNPKVKHISEFEKDYGIAWDYADWNQPIMDHKSKLLLIHKAVVNYKMIGGKSSWIKDDTEFASIIEEDLILPNYNLIICGHWHKQYKFIYKKTTIINPGPVLRRTVEEKEKPTVQIINLENKIRKIHQLKSVKPTEIVISDRHLEANIHQVKIDIIEFINALKNKERKYNSSFLDNLMMLLDSHELDNPIEEILRKIIADLIEVKGKKNVSNNNTI